MNDFELTVPDLYKYLHAILYQPLLFIGLGIGIGLC